MITVLQILLFLLLAAYAVFLFRTRLKPKYIKRSALAIFVAGTALYAFAFSLEDFAQGPLAVLGRSMLLSFKMFLYDGSIFELVHAQHTTAFLELYFFVFYAAVLTSTSAIIMLFGKRAMTLFALCFRKKKFKHVFIGMNKRSESIVRNIRGEEVALIEFPSDTSENEISIQNVIKGVSREEKTEFSASGQSNISVLFAKRRLTLDESSKDVFRTMGLDRLKHFIDDGTAFYLLSEDTERNLDELMALLSDKRLTENTIHVCMPREGVARYYKTTLKRTGVHFIYPSSLAVVELMKNPSCHPAFVMKPETDAEGRPTGAVNGEFNAMVIGFGETGQAVTKFLYEFSSAIHGDGSVLPAHIFIQDEHIDSLKGPFEFNCPDVAGSGIIEYEDTGTESSEFWTRLVERLDSLNYIAISMHNDASNLDLACTIMMYAFKKRKNGMENFRIAVRKRYTLSHERELVAKFNEKAGREVMVCYGEYEKIFTSEMIISDSRSGINSNATSLAGRLADAYALVSGKAAELNGDSQSYRSKSRARMELHQFISRANHAGSLAILLGGTIPAELSGEALENVAKTEHLRYARYLTAHGYSFAAEDDELLKTNHQICGWDELSEEEKEYHRDMVRAQLKVTSGT